MRGMRAQTIFSHKDARTPLMLAQQILNKLQDPAYMYSHYMPHNLEKVQLRRELRTQYPGFYADKPELASILEVHNRAISNCEAIFDLLSGIQCFSKSMSTVNDYDL